MERAIRKERMDVAAELEAELWCPPFPIALLYVWQAWLRMRRRAPAGFNGANPITIEAIDAFIRRTGLKLSPQDIALIEDIDDIFLKSLAEHASEQDQQQALRDGMDQASRQGMRQVGGSLIRS